MQFDDPEIAKRKLRALVIDDNEHMRALLRRLLQRMGIENTEYAMKRGIGSRRIRDARPHLTDLTMQFMDGISFTRTIRRSPNEKVQITPVIMITGQADRHRVVEARDVGGERNDGQARHRAGLLTRVQEVILRPRAFNLRPQLFWTLPAPARRSELSGVERRRTVLAI